MLGVIQIPLGADPVRATAVCVFLMALGFALAMLYDAALRKAKDEVVRSSSASLFCLGCALGNMVRHRQHVAPFQPIFLVMCLLLTAAILLIIGFSMTRRKRGVKA